MQDPGGVLASDNLYTLRTQRVLVAKTRRRRRERASEPDILPAMFAFYFFSRVIVVVGFKIRGTLAFF